MTATTKHQGITLTKIIHGVYRLQAYLSKWVPAHKPLLITFAILAALIAIGVGIIITAIKRRIMLRTAAKRNFTNRIRKKLGHGEEAKKFVKWPQDPYAVGAKITVRYPQKFSATEQDTKIVPEVINSLVGGQWDADHDHLHNRLVYVRRPLPKKLPTSLRYEDHPSDPVDLIKFSQNIDHNWLTIDLTHLTPHVVVSASTGWGKTSILSLIIAHVAARGGLIDICDPKQIGFLSRKAGEFNLGGLPMIRISTELDEMLRTIERFRDEMDETNRKLKAGTADPDRPLRLLVIDELGTFNAMVIDQWQADGNKGTPTVFRDMRRILWQGRQSGFHVVNAAQQANVNALFGTSDARDQYGLRIAAGPQSDDAWRMLFGRTTKIDSGAIKGRAIVGIGSELTTVQMAQITPTQARKIASRGRARFPEALAEHVGDGGIVCNDPNRYGGYTTQHTAHTLHAVPDVKIISLAKVARAESKAEGRELVQMKCNHCHFVWHTSAAEKTILRCPGPRCGKPKRVPVGARSKIG